MHVDGGDGELYDISEVDEEKLQELLELHMTWLADPRDLTPKNMQQDMVDEIKGEIEFRKKEGL